MAPLESEIVSNYVINYRNVKLKKTEELLFPKSLLRDKIISGLSNVLKKFSKKWELSKDLTFEDIRPNVLLRSFCETKGSSLFDFIHIHGNSYQVLINHVMYHYHNNILHLERTYGFSLDRQSEGNPLFDSSTLIDNIYVLEDVEVGEQGTIPNNQIELRIVRDSELI